MTTNTAMLAGMLRGANLSMEDVLAAAAEAGLADAAVKGVPSAAGTTKPVPTVAEFYAVVAAAAEHANGDEARGGGMFRTYEPYWRLFVEGYPYQRKGVRTKKGRVGDTPVHPDEKLYEGCGTKLVTDVTAADITEAAKWTERRALLDAHWKATRRRDRGRSTRELNQQGAKANFYGAMRYFFATVVGERLLDAEMNPTDTLARPAKSESNRRSFTAAELAELWAAVVSGGDDPELDALMVETVLVTGARREGLINLHLGRLNWERASMWLEEKNGKVQEQPATRDLIERLEAFARSRGAKDPDDPVFCFKDSVAHGSPRRITDRRFDTLHTRIQKALPWADRLGVTIHWVRHHAVTQVQRIAGDAVAARYARHRNTSTTRIYDKASGEEVCAAVGIMTGRPHPLTEGGW